MGILGLGALVQDNSYFLRHSILRSWDIAEQKQISSTQYCTRSNSTAALACPASRKRTMSVLMTREKVLFTSDPVAASWIPLWFIR